MADVIRKDVDVTSDFCDDLEDKIKELVGAWHDGQTNEGSDLWDVVMDVVSKSQPSKEFKLDNIIADQGYTEEGTRFPELRVHWVRSKTEEDRKKEEDTRLADLQMIGRLASKHNYSLALFEPNRNMSIQDVRVHGHPVETGTYLLWIWGSHKDKAEPLSYYYYAEEQRWYMDSSKTAPMHELNFTVYQGPIPLQRG